MVELLLREALIYIILLCFVRLNYSLGALAPVLSSLWELFLTSVPLCPCLGG